ncbi:unnamed protein product [Lactuca saligna]|uniref:Myb/SANT-like domain-containing protein n=1 Tax=Lactuca saligna TaxID=75948 RepID=A0AA35ZJW1_LACSI|nr:unnamed protein product [Lactuca saligna]
MDKIHINVVDCETSKKKVVWDNNTFKVFGDACVIEVKKGNRPTSHFNKVGWENLKKYMKEKTGKNYERKQLKNKWDIMKKEWKLYDRLIRIETGIGGTRSLIYASPEWWEEKIKENKEYAKFRDTDLSTFDIKSAILFQDSVAVGDKTMTPLKFQNNEENMEGEGDSDEINLDDDETLFPSFLESSSSKRKKSKNASNSRSTKMDSDDSNSSDDNEECWVEEDREFESLCGLALKGIILAFKIRRPCHTSARTGVIFINEVLNGHPRRCYEMFRLHVPVFRQICIDIATNYGLKQTRNISLEESVGIFFMTLSHGCSNRFVQEFFNHYGETIHRHFHIVLADVLKMSADIIRPAANYNDEVPEYILNNPRYYPMFKDCIGAIDGTHVRASVRQHEEAKYIGRKGYATQNIMRPDLHFPFPTGDKYYVVDVGYPNTRGYLAPYKGANIRYHLLDFRRGHIAAIREPRAPKEKFNFYHSSLRNIIERTFGVWKARWALLRDMHVNYKYEHQVSIVIASMAIRKYITKTGRFDEAFNRAQQESYIPAHNRTSSEGDEEGPSTHRTSNDSSYMAAI